MNEVKKQKKRIKHKTDTTTHKRVSVVVAVIFFAFIVIADIFLIMHHDTAFSETENRMLQQVPEMTGSKLVSGKYMKQFEDFVSDQFFERDNWIQTKLKIDKLLGKKESNGVYLGSKGYLFEGTPAYDQKMTDATVIAIDSFISAHESLNNVVAIVPNASAIYPDYIPPGAEFADQKKELDRIESLLSGSVNFVNLYDALYEHRSEQLYFKSDHHWNSTGARYAFEAIAKVLGITNPTSKYSIMNVTDDFSGTMASTSGSFQTTDNIEIFIADNIKDYYVEYDGDPTKYSTIYDRSALDRKNQYEVFLGGNHPKLTITIANETKKNLLLIKDSYANCFVQFLLPYYDKIVIIDPRYYSDDLEDEIKNSRITDVLFLYNLNTFVEDRSLQAVLNN